MLNHNNFVMKFATHKSEGQGTVCLVVECVYVGCRRATKYSRRANQHTSYFQGYPWKFKYIKPIDIVYSV